MKKKVGVLFKIYFLFVPVSVFKLQDLLLQNDKKKRLGNRREDKKGRKEKI